MERERESGMERLEVAGEKVEEWRKECDGKEKRYKMHEREGEWGKTANLVSEREHRAEEYKNKNNVLYLAVA